MDSKAVRIQTDNSVLNAVGSEQLRTVAGQLGESVNLVIVFRSDKPEQFAQAAGPAIFSPNADIPSGNFVVEYRTQHGHFQAVAPPDVVVQILTGWAFDVSGWKNLAEWREVNLSC